MTGSVDNITRPRCLSRSYPSPRPRRLIRNGAHMRDLGQMASAPLRRREVRSVLSIKSFRRLWISRRCPAWGTGWPACTVLACLFTDWHLTRPAWGAIAVAASDHSLLPTCFSARSPGRSPIALTGGRPGSHRRVRAVRYLVVDPGVGSPPADGCCRPFLFVCALVLDPGQGRVYTQPRAANQLDRPISSTSSRHTASAPSPRRCSWPSFISRGLANNLAFFGTRPGLPCAVLRRATFVVSVRSYSPSSLVIAAAAASRRVGEQVGLTKSIWRAAGSSPRTRSARPYDWHHRRDRRRRRESASARLVERPGGGIAGYGTYSGRVRRARVGMSWAPVDRLDSRRRMSGWHRGCEISLAV